MICRNITVKKTARYFLLGNPDGEIKQVLFVCHGYAQLANEFIESFLPLEREGLLIVAPEGLHRFYARGAADKVVASWMTKEAREDDIRDYVNMLDQVYINLTGELKSKPKITVLGFSQGAATVSRWCAMSQLHFDELILYCGFFPPDLPPNGIPKHVRLTVATASDDKFISPEQEKEQMGMMHRLNPNLKHLPFQGKHEIDAKIVLQLI
jgi:predicted esterase